MFNKYITFFLKYRLFSLKMGMDKEQMTLLHLTYGVAKPLRNYAGQA
jgi:hypothetical protein